MLFRSRATLCLVAAMALVGSNVPLGKAIVRDVPIYAFTFFRFALSSLALLALAAHETGPRLRDLTRTEARDLLAMAAFGMVGFTVLMLEGVKRTAAADAGIITATLPAVVALFGVIVFRERLTRARAGAILCAVAGLALVQADRKSTRLNSSHVVTSRMPSSA